MYPFMFTKKLEMQTDIFILHSSNTKVITVLTCEVESTQC